MILTIFRVVSEIPEFQSCAGFNSIPELRWIRQSYDGHDKASMKPSFLGR